MYATNLANKTKCINSNLFSMHWFLEYQTMDEVQKPSNSEHNFLNILFSLINISNWIRLSTLYK
jgi:hypothetical protein